MKLARSCAANAAREAVAAIAPERTALSFRRIARNAAIEANRTTASAATPPTIPWVARISIGSLWALFGVCPNSIFQYRGSRYFEYAIPNASTPTPSTG